MKHLLEQVITESLQNKKEFGESSKKEGGGDTKHVGFLLGLIKYTDFRIRKRVQD